MVEDEEKSIMTELHKGDCGGHHYWKEIVNNIWRASFYWPTMFSNIYKEVSLCHQIFDGKRKLLPLPLNPI